MTLHHSLCLKRGLKSLVIRRFIVMGHSDVFTKWGVHVIGLMKCNYSQSKEGSTEDGHSRQQSPAKVMCPLQTFLAKAQNLDCKLDKNTRVHRRARLAVKGMSHLVQVCSQPALSREHLMTGGSASKGSRCIEGELLV